MIRRGAFTLLAAFFAILAFVTFAPNHGRTSIAYAQNCGVAFMTGNCLTQTSTMAGVVVNHVDLDDEEPSVVTYVEPDDTDSWQITALYSTTDMAAPPSCQCTDYDSSVTADVKWTGTGWTVSCSGCSFPNGPILSVSVCDEASCATGGLPNEVHGWSYRLVARVKEVRLNQCGTNPAFIRGVTFATTAVDNGDTIDDVNCSEISAVSPTSQTWSATDFGMSCNSNCTSVAGPTIDIIYD